MDNVLNEIKEYIERCQNCPTFQQGRCRYFYKEVEDEFPFDDPFAPTKSDNQAYYTQKYKVPCGDQQHPNNFLNNIEAMLEKADCYYPPEKLNAFFNKCYRLHQKVLKYNEIIANVLEDSVKSAINQCISFVDKASLEHNENIMPFIKDIEVEYTRKEGLFKLIPCKSSIQHIEDCAYVSTTKIIQKGEKDRYGTIFFWFQTGTEITKICHHHHYCQLDSEDPENENATYQSEHSENISDELPEIAQAKIDGKISEGNQLTITNADFVCYCYDHKFFFPHRLNDWRVIDGKLTDKKGKILTANQLAQAFRDLQQKEECKD